MNRFMSIFLVFTINSWLFAAPVIDPALRDELSRSQEKNLTVILRFKQENKTLSFDSMSPLEVQETKMRLARKSQAAFLEGIKTTAAIQGEIQRLKSLWLDNSMILRATGQFISTLLERDDLERILLNRRLKILKPVEVPAKSNLDPREHTYGLEKIQATRVWNELGLNGAGVRVAVLDSGADSSHDDLIGKVLASRDFISEYSDNTPNDAHGHGTHVAGTIAGGNSSGRNIGVAPGSKLLIAKVFDDEGGSTLAAILEGMQWAADPDGNPTTADQPRIASNSWGGPLSDVYEPGIQTWREMGIIPVCAAGNYGPEKQTIIAPAGYQDVIAVGASGHDDSIAEFSARGPVQYGGKTYIKPDIVAPGVNIQSAKPGGGLDWMSGTSMATPHIAGVIALMLQADPDLSLQAVHTILKTTAKDIGEPGQDNESGHGRVDAYDAVKYSINGGEVILQIHSGEQLASVRVLENEKIFQSDSKGLTSLFLPAGKYRLEVSAFGHETKILEVEIRAKESIHTELSLDKSHHFDVRFRTRDKNNVPRESIFSFLNTPLDSGASQNGVFSTRIPGGVYRIQVKSFGFRTKVLELEIQSNLHYEMVVENLPRTLVIERDLKEGFETYFTSALQSLGEDFDLYHSIPLKEITAYQTIIWLAGNNGNQEEIFTPQERTMVRQYVQNGGRILISGQDIAYAYRRNPEFLWETAGAYLIKDDSPDKSLHGEGFDLELDGGDSANNQKWPDVLEISQSAIGEVRTLFQYGNGKSAGIIHKFGSGKLILLGFGFEGVKGNQVRTELMDHLLNLLEPSVESKMDHIAWSFQRNQHAYQALLKNFTLREEDRDAVERYLEGEAEKAPFRTILQALMK